MPGYVYVAHNAEYRDGLCKVGYTTRTPAERLNHLNEQVRLAKDIGAFELVHSAAVPAAFDDEQRLFALLDALRHAPGREFFHGSTDMLAMAVDSIASGEPLGALFDVVAGAMPAADVEPSSADWSRFSSQSCVYSTRNPCHKPDTYRIGWTERDPAARLKQMNALQRRYTSQVGFYRLVHVVPAAYPQVAARDVLTTLAAFRLNPRKPFVRVAQDMLLATMLSAASRPMPAPPTPPKPEPSGSVTPSIRATAVPRAFGEWAPWAAPCPACGILLRFQGRIGAADAVPCPECAVLIRCEIGPREVAVRK